ncbi:uncharacterized protein EI90DRAFT_219679 [Cantharellus anzutake]|uniref:uncharacterized protein n=1 Tax=Cantharellus anzutake TaxID=1750568 RepID=UPI001905E28C|nr:uncharacterized protein EI90DRAFT_219679 [Cantharellus anzutake]KAF8316920.1 hypothetical protein EI90DRAFT_219679 [Cantharellus anzutake]
MLKSPLIDTRRMKRLQAHTMGPPSAPALAVPRSQNGYCKGIRSKIPSYSSDGDGREEDVRAVRGARVNPILEHIHKPGIACLNRHRFPRGRWNNGQPEDLYCRIAVDGGSDIAPRLDLEHKRIDEPLPSPQKEESAPPPKDDLLRDEDPIPIEVKRDATMLLCD